MKRYKKKMMKRQSDGRREKGEKAGGLERERESRYMYVEYTYTSYVMNVP